MSNRIFLRPDDRKTLLRYYRGSPVPADRLRCHILREVIGNIPPRACLLVALGVLAMGLVCWGLTEMFGD